MIIKTIDEVLIRNGNNKIQANKERMNLIKHNDKKTIELYFEKIKQHIQNKNLLGVQYILEYNLYFEEIETEFVKEIMETYLNLKEEKQETYINCLEESYKVRGRKGILFSLGGIIKRFKVSIDC
ncbi:hypothetical protein [Paraclostridium sordellii]|uniref:hypothetical protein n=1 Tax=Paraclostridium sordellii TaxID=1505 RepID=UPI0022E0E485|nr:hypothetical protein [Paeniclostridium sordellii]